ncbi:MAG: phospholipase D-like domain-containing protein, partial [Methanobacterium sp.]
MEKLNGKVYGQLVDDKGNPLSDIKLRAIADYTSIFEQDPELGTAITDKQGIFGIKFNLDAEFMDNKKNQIKLEFLIDEELIMDISKGIEDDVIDFGIIKYDKGNIGVEGRVIDEKGNPIEGITVMAEDIDFGKIKLNALDLIKSKFKSAKSIIEKESPLNKPINHFKSRAGVLFSLQDDLLGSTTTDKGGYYRIIYPPIIYREIMDKDPDIRLIIKDKLGVFDIKKTEVYNDVTETIKNFEDIVIKRGWIEGWFVTLENSHPSRISYNNSFEILIDNKDVMEKIVEVLEGAESYVYLTQYEFYPDFVPRFFPLNDDEYEADDVLVSKLLDVKKRGADVKIILNENTFVPDSYDEINGYFKDTDVEVRKLWAKGPYAMHAKVVVVDGKEGFIIGSPFNQSYWDTEKHFINEKRRLNKNEGPVHDFSIYLKGNVIGHLEEFFIELWNYLSDENFNGNDKILKEISISTDNNPPDGLKHVENYVNPLKSDNESIQITRSITPNTISKEGEMGVLEAYRRAITNAKDFIYLENQYFTNKYIINALKRALESNPDLQLIMLINEVPDVPSYRSWQHYGFELLGLDLNKLLIEHPRIGVFAKWSGDFKNNKNRL